jgi:hypothetical protein
MFILTPITPLKKGDIVNPKCNVKICLPRLLKGILPKAPFSKETLKDHLQETLKKLKMGNFNEESSKHATLQYDEILK